MNRHHQRPRTTRRKQERQAPAVIDPNRHEVRHWVRFTRGDVRAIETVQVYIRLPTGKTTETMHPDRLLLTGMLRLRDSDEGTVTHFNQTKAALRREAMQKIKDVFTEATGRGIRVDFRQ